MSEFIFQDNPDAAASTVAAIVKAVKALEYFSALGRIGRISGTHELVVSGTPYIVPYRARGEAVQVIRVFNTSRKWPASF